MSLIGGTKICGGKVSTWAEIAGLGVTKTTATITFISVLLDRLLFWYIRSLETCDFSNLLSKEKNESVGNFKI